MSDGTSCITLKLEYWTDSVGAFDPTKVLSRIHKAFPDAVIDETDVQEVRLLKELEHWNSEEMSEEQRKRFIRSSKILYRTNGPTFSFQIPFGLEQPVRGWARRYSVRFDVPHGAPQRVTDALVSFLKSLQMGEPELEIDPAIDV
jgi:hypothetical protein